MKRKKIINMDLTELQNYLKEVSDKIKDIKKKNNITKRARHSAVLRHYIQKKYKVYIPFYIKDKKGNRYKNEFYKLLDMITTKLILINIIGYRKNKISKKIKMAKEKGQFEVIHQKCGGEVILEDNGACGDPECCGEISNWMECQKCGKVWR